MIWMHRDEVRGGIRCAYVVQSRPVRDKLHGEFVIGCVEVFFYVMGGLPDRMFPGEYARLFNR